MDIHGVDDVDEDNYDDPIVAEAVFNNYVKTAYHDRSALDPASIIGFIKREARAVPNQLPAANVPDDIATAQQHLIPDTDRAGRSIAPLLASTNPHQTGQTGQQMIGIQYSKEQTQITPKGRFLDVYAESVAKAHAVLGENLAPIMQAMVDAAKGTKAIRKDKFGNEVEVYDTEPDVKAGLALLDRGLGRPAVTIEQTDQATKEQVILYLPDNGRDPDQYASPMPERDITIDVQPVHPADTGVVPPPGTKLEHPSDRAKRLMEEMEMAASSPNFGVLNLPTKENTDENRANNEETTVSAPFSSRISPETAFRDVGGPPLGSSLV